MKYFARIDKKNVGPFSLSQLVETGIRPSTYIWHKGLPDWIPASEDPEVCRGIRRYLAGFDPETGAPIHSLSSSALTAQRESKEDSSTESATQPHSVRSFPEPADSTDYNIPPTGVSVIMAVVVTICCFPLTGFVAIFFAMRSKANWKMSEQEGIDEKTRSIYRHNSHNDARIYRMMVGISFFLGLILVGLTFSRTFM